MDKVIKPLIDQLVSMIQGGRDIVNEQLPDVAKQILRLFLWGNVIEIPILIGILVLLVYTGKWCYIKASEDNWEKGPFILGWIPITILGIIIGNYAYSCGQAMLTAILAPKLLIIQQLRILTK